MKTIYLHIGVGKTGTTSIQRFLTKNRMPLFDLGIHYLQSGDLGDGTGHQNFAKSFIVDWPGFGMTHGDLALAQQEILNEINQSNFNSILISSENFQLACPKLVYEFFQQIPNVTIKIILFVRAQDELAESSYNQLVKLGREKRSFFEFFSETYRLGWYDFYSLAEKWSQYFDSNNMQAVLFDAQKGNSIEQLLREIKVSEIQSEGFEFPAKQDNASVGYTKLMAIKNNSIPEEAIVSQNEGGSKELPALVFDVSEAHYIRLLVEQSNLKFSKKYLGTEMSDFGLRKFSDNERYRIRKLIAELHSK